MVNPPSPLLMIVSWRSSNHDFQWVLVEPWRMTVTCPEHLVATERNGDLVDTKIKMRVCCWSITSVFCPRLEFRCGQNPIGRTTRDFVFPISRFRLILHLVVFDFSKISLWIRLFQLPFLLQIESCGPICVWSVPVYQFGQSLPHHLCDCLRSDKPPPRDSSIKIRSISISLRAFTQLEIHLQLKASLNVFECSTGCWICCGLRILDSKAKQLCLGRMWWADRSANSMLLVDRCVKSTLWRESEKEHRFMVYILWRLENRMFEVPKSLWSKC